jgi:hypothetical protein
MLVGRRRRPLDYLKPKTCSATLISSSASISANETDTDYRTSINGKTLSLETGKLAKQADGAVIVRFGDSVVTQPAARPANGRDRLPAADGRLPEYTYASGRIPGRFFKRRQAGYRKC